MEFELMESEFLKKENSKLSLAKEKLEKEVARLQEKVRVLEPRYDLLLNFQTMSLANLSNAILYSQFERYSEAVKGYCHGKRTKTSETYHSMVNNIKEPKSRDFSGFRRSQGTSSLFQDLRQWRPRFANIKVLIQKEYPIVMKRFDSMIILIQQLKDFFYFLFESRKDKSIAEEAEFQPVFTAFLSHILPYAFPYSEGCDIFNAQSYPLEVEIDSKQYKGKSDIFIQCGSNSDDIMMSLFLLLFELKSPFASLNHSNSYPARDQTLMELEGVKRELDSCDLPSTTVIGLLTDLFTISFHARCEENKKTVFIYSRRIYQKDEESYLLLLFFSLYLAQNKGTVDVLETLEKYGSFCGVQDDEELEQTIASSKNEEPVDDVLTNDSLGRMLVSEDLHREDGEDDGEHEEQHNGQKKKSYDDVPPRLGRQNRRDDDEDEERENMRGGGNAMKPLASSSQAQRNNPPKQSRSNKSSNQQQGDQSKSTSLTDDIPSLPLKRNGPFFFTKPTSIGKKHLTFEDVFVPRHLYRDYDPYKDEEKSDDEAEEEVEYENDLNKENSFCDVQKKENILK